MNELYTFKTCCGRYQITVKGSFLQRCRTPSDWDTYDLNNQFGMAKFIHNPSGPAIIDFEHNLVQYWLDGKHLTREEGEKIAHQFHFNNKLMDVLFNE